MAKKPRGKAQPQGEAEVGNPTEVAEPHVEGEPEAVQHERIGLQILWPRRPDEHLYVIRTATGWVVTVEAKDEATAMQFMEAECKKALPEGVSVPVVRCYTRETPSGRAFVTREPLDDAEAKDPFIEVEGVGLIDVHRKFLTLSAKEQGVAVDGIVAGMNRGPAPGGAGEA